jgi:ADP-ribose pyrophosphatase
LADFSQLRTEQLHQWAVWSLERGSFRSASGEEFERTYVRSPGAVAVVPVLELAGEESVVLVRQFRAALGRSILEIPAGMRDVEGEDPESTAGRELAEETGYVASSLSFLGVLASAPGITDSEVIIYEGRELTIGETNRHGPEEHHMDVVVMPLKAALDLVFGGEITDAKTMIGLLMLSEKRSGKR